MKRRSKKIHLQQPANFKNKLLLWAQQFDKFVWLDSNPETLGKNQNYSNFDSVLAIGLEQELRCNYKNAFNQLKEFQTKTNDYIFGYLGYDLKNNIEKLQSVNLDNLGFSDLYFFQPKKIFFFKDNLLEIRYLSGYLNEIEKDLEAINSQDEMLDTPKNLEQHDVKIRKRITKKQYFKKLNNILEHIHRGNIYEVNFCQEFYSKNTTIDPLQVYQKLNAISTPPFASFLKIDHQFLLSASPERFVKKQGIQIISQPIKGTAKRLINSIDDKRNASLLEQDLKERAENIMIVDLVRNDLSKTAIKGSVQVEELCKVYSFKQVHQLISTVVSKVEKETNPVDIIESLFPMGSMTGAPKISAMKIIEQEEETKRGLYSGAVGYFTPENDFDFNVVIRSILYNKKQKYISFSVGSAITVKSNPKSEYQECLLKAIAMKKALKS
ncbi:MAG: anthranilate synthase component I family protein [Flavobacteriaceae bacterium]|nr:anthranilate synthase component I family protein [Flavobacteriaceae bacterium]